MNIGDTFLHGVLWTARLLVGESAPGYVGLILLSWLVAAAAIYTGATLRQRQAITALRKIVGRHSDARQFAAGIDEVSSELAASGRKGADFSAIVAAWQEYRETIVFDDQGGEIVGRNSIRPSAFLNADDLGFTPGFFRIVPGLFVSFGLLCTFLGLVAALNQLGEGLMQGSAPDRVVTNLMTIASAKFTMSLVGLFCSIVFSIVLRRGQIALDRELHRLCHALEKRLSFVSLEDLGIRQLRAAEEQRNQLRQIGMEMVADLKRPLTDLPGHISQSISTVLEPVLDRVGQMGTASVEGMVGDLSTQISHSVGNALTRASEALEEASDRIGRMVDRMNNSNAQMGEGMQAALGQMASAIADLRSQVEATGQTAASTMTQGAEQLLAVMNQTLEGIRQNTGQGAQAISAAAEEMRKAAEGFRAEITTASAEGAGAIAARVSEASQRADEAIDGAGRALMAAFGKTGAEIARLGDEMGSRIGTEITGRIEALTQQLDAMVAAVGQGASGMQTAATSIKSGGESFAAASVQFGGASRELVAATGPVRASHERIESALTALQRAVQSSADTVAQSSQSVAQSAAAALDSATAALGTEREGIRQSLEAVRAALGRLSTEAERLDQIDTMLGKAISDYGRQLEAALGSAQDHIERMRETLAPGIDTLRSVVERAETFVPRGARN